MDLSVPTLFLTERPHYTSEGQIVTTVRSKKVWEVLALVAFSQNQVLDRELIAKTVWGESDVKSALQNLRQTIRYAKTYLPGVELWLKAERFTVSILASKLNIVADRDKFLEKFAANWSVDPFSNPLISDIEDDSVFFPFKRLDLETRRATLIGMTPGLINLGHFANGIEEIEAVRKSPVWKNDLSLALSEIEFRIAAKQIQEAKEILNTVREHPAAKKPHNRARILAYDSTCSFNDGDYVRCRNQAYEVLKLSADQGGNRQISRSFTMAIAASYYLGEVDTVKRILKKALKLNEKDAGGSWNLVFRFLDAYMEIETNSDAAKSRLPSLKEAFWADTQNGINGIYLARTGHLYLRTGNGAEAENIYNEALRRLKGTDCRQETAEVHSYLGDLYGGRQDYARAFRSHVDAVTLRRPLSAPLGLATSLRGAGVAATELGLGDQAMAFFEEAGGLFYNLRNPFGVASTQIGVARNLKRMGRIAESKALYRKALSEIEAAYEKTPRMVRPAEFESIESIQAEYLAMG